MGGGSSLFSAIEGAGPHVAFTGRRVEAGRPKDGQGVGSFWVERRPGPEVLRAAALFTIAPGEDGYSPFYELKLQKLHEGQSFHDVSLKLPHLHCIDLGVERKVGLDESPVPIDLIIFSFDPDHDPLFSVESEDLF